MYNIFLFRWSRPVGQDTGRSADVPSGCLKRVGCSITRKAHCFQRSHGARLAGAGSHSVVLLPWNRHRHASGRRRRRRHLHPPAIGSCLRSKLGSPPSQGRHAAAAEAVGAGSCVARRTSAAGNRWGGISAEAQHSSQAAATRTAAAAATAVSHPPWQQHRLTPATAAKAAARAPRREHIIGQSHARRAQSPGRAAIAALQPRRGALRRQNWIQPPACDEPARQQAREVSKE